MPPVIPDYDKTLVNVCTELAKRWVEWNENTTMPFAITDIESFFPGQKVAFFTDLHKSSTVLSLNKVQRMADIYKLDSVKNCEIRYKNMHIFILPVTIVQYNFS